MDKILFTIGEYDFSYDQLVGICLVVLFCWFLNGLLTRWLVPRLTRNKEVPEESIKYVKRQISFLVSLLFVLISIVFLGINQIVFETDDFNYLISHIINLLITIQAMRIIFWFISNLYIHDFYSSRDDKDQAGFKQEKNALEQERTVNRVFRYILTVLAIIFLLNLFNIDLSLYENTLKDGTSVSFKISSILISILIFLFAQLVVWLFIQIILYSVYKRRKVDHGAQYAINQLFKYVVFVIAFILILDNLGLDITILLTGAAALLVGIGLGLQQTFNDFISGLVLLFERTVAVGDVLEIGPTVGIVKKIGLRASTIETRGNVTMLVPNSKLVNDSVINWTHFDDKVRFNVSIGVAYGSDTELVKKILLDVAMDNPYIINYPAPFVRFNDFQDSALSFTVFFFSRNFIVIEDIKSDMRFEIDRLFRENNISIPFPQHDVWLRSSGPKK